MQKRISCQAAAANVSRIPVNFGFNQNHMALYGVAINMQAVSTQLLCIITSLTISTYRFKVQGSKVAIEIYVLLFL